MIKKLLIFCTILLSASFAINSLIATPTYAQNGSYVDGTCDYTLGFTSWNCNVNISNEESLKTGIWQIAANVATDITVAAAYLVLGYVIYGGYLYIFATGDPSKVAAGKKTLYQAFLGLAIVMSAFAIMSTIRLALIGESGNFGNCLDISVAGSVSGTDTCIDANTTISGAISWFIAIAGVIAAIFLVYGGIGYVTSSGDPSKLKKAKDTIIYSLIGLAIVGLAQIITAFVTNMIREANSTPTTSLNINIEKELHA